MRELEILKYKRKYILIRDVRTNKKYNILKKDTINKYSFPTGSSIIFTEQEIELKVNSYDADFLFFETDEDLYFLNNLKLSYFNREEEYEETVFYKNNTMLFKSFENYCKNKDMRNTSIKFLKHSSYREYFLSSKNLNFQAFEYNHSEMINNISEISTYIENLNYISSLCEDTEKDEIKRYKEKQENLIEFTRRVFECCKVSDLTLNTSTRNYLYNSYTSIIEELECRREDFKKEIKLLKEIQEFFFLIFL